MRFCVFAFATVPDVHTARRVFDLDGLDDKAVAKVLFHQRKQQTGAHERLRWDQQMLAAMSLIRHEPDKVMLESFNLFSHTEPEMLRAYHAASQEADHTVSWGGKHFDIPLMRFRSLIHCIGPSGTEQSLQTQENDHVDIVEQLSTKMQDRPQLNETAIKLGFPGLMGHSEGDITDAWLQQRYDDVQAYSDLSALNIYLLALRMYAVNSQFGKQDYSQFEQRLRSVLNGRETEPVSDFLRAWGNT